MGVLVWLGAVLAAAGIEAAVADIVARVVPGLGRPLGRDVFIVGLLGAIGDVNILGAAPGARLVGVLTICKLAPLAILLAVGAFHVRAANFALSLPAPSAFGRALLLAAFSFQGMEGALAVSGEVRRPARNIPLGAARRFASRRSTHVASDAAQFISDRVQFTSCSGSMS